MKWFASFLIGRVQRVRVGEAISPPLQLSSGVPQGGILSPILFTIVTADIQDWVKYSSLFGYADDTSSSCKGKCIVKLLRELEEDAKRILQFMASNGLVANPNKTAFIILNQKGETKHSVKVGNYTVKQESSTKLLGMIIDDNQKWKNHVIGKGGLTTSLNQRLYAIKRLKNHLPSTEIRKVAESLQIKIWPANLGKCKNDRRSTNTLPCYGSTKGTEQLT